MASVNCEEAITWDLQAIYENSYNISSISQLRERERSSYDTVNYPLGHNKRRNKGERGSRCRLISGLVVGVKTDGVVNLALECKCISRRMFAYCHVLAVINCVYIN